MLHVPQVPPHPSGPQFFPAQSAVHEESSSSPQPRGAMVKTRVMASQENFVMIPSLSCLWIVPAIYHERLVSSRKADVEPVVSPTWERTRVPHAPHGISGNIPCPSLS